MYNILSWWSLSPLFLLLQPKEQVAVIAWISPLKSSHVHHRLNRLDNHRRDPSCPSLLQVSLSSSSTGASPQDEEVVYLDEGDDDDDEEKEYDYQALLAQKQERIAALQELAQMSSSRDDSKAIILRAESIVSDLFETYVETEESALFPDVPVYNCLVEAHAYSSSFNDDDDHDGAQQAESLLNRMEAQENEYMPKPDWKTYIHVMDAFSMRKNPAKAEEILKRLENHVMTTTTTTGDEEESPETMLAEGYNKLIKAYGMAGDVAKGESILRELLEGKSISNILVKANQNTWVQVMKAYLHVSPEKVQELFNEMKEMEDYLPQTPAYNVLMRALGKTSSGEAAEKILFEMMDDYRVNGDSSSCKPNTETFRNVILAYNNRASAAKIEQLLQIHEGLFMSNKNEDATTTSSSLPGMGRLYDVAIGAMARAKDRSKAKRAQRVLEKMKVHAKNSPHDGPTIRTYVKVLSASAYTSDKNLSPEDRWEAFQVAANVFQDLQTKSSSSLSNSQQPEHIYAPDASCYGMFLKACANLIPKSNSQKRDGIVKKLFQQCCQEGLVNDFVLRELERASSEALELELLGGFLDDGISIPSDWSANVVALEP